MQEIDTKLQIILEYLESNDLGNQASALQALNRLLFEVSLEPKQLEPFIQFIEREIKRKDVEIYIDLIRTASLLGKSNFEYIKNIYPIISSDLQSKNRFKVEIVLDLLSSHINSSIPPINQTFNEILLHGHEWFDHPNLIPIFRHFFESVTESGGFRFIAKNHARLTKFLVQLPPSMKQIKDLLQTKIEEYQAFLKAEEEKRIAEKEAKRKLEEAQRALEMKKKEIEEKRKKILKDLTKPQLVEDDLSKVPTVKIEVDEPEEQEERDESWASFSSFGLKRKDTD